MVERREVERLDGLGLPKPQRVAGADAVAGDRRVVGDALHYRLGNPAHAKSALLVRPRLGAPAKPHFVRDFRPRDLPWIAVAQPFVCDLALPAVADDLIENAELVANAIADCGHLDRGKRVHVTRREPSKSAVAESGLLLLLREFRRDRSRAACIASRAASVMPRLSRLFARCGPGRNSAER